MRYAILFNYPESQNYFSHQSGLTCADLLVHPSLFLFTRQLQALSSYQRYPLDHLLFPSFRKYSEIYDIIIFHLN